MAKILDNWTREWVQLPSPFPQDNDDEEIELDLTLYDMRGNDNGK